MDKHVDRPQLVSQSEVAQLNEFQDQHALDCHVGSRIEMLRTSLGLSQSELGEALGVTAEHVHAYECGVQAVSAARLLDLSQLLGTSIGYFFGENDAKPAESALGDALPQHI